MHTVLHHALLDCDLSLLRNKETPISVFRGALERIAFHLAVAATQQLATQEGRIETPLEQTQGYTLRSNVILLPILRAGLTLLHPFTHLLPQATVGYLGLKRNEQTLEPHEYYANIPPLDATTTTIILDPMLATGGSICAALHYLQQHNAQEIIIASVIAAPEGIARVEREYPDVRIVTAALDRELNDHGYIMPGLGDAGDRAHGTL